MLCCVLLHAVYLYMNDCYLQVGVALLSGFGDINVDRTDGTKPKVCLYAHYICIYLYVKM
jgi:hypothetical protein